MTLLNFQINLYNFSYRHTIFIKMSMNNKEHVIYDIYRKFWTNDIEIIKFMITLVESICTKTLLWCLELISNLSFEFLWDFLFFELLLSQTNRAMTQNSFIAFWETISDRAQNGKFPQQLAKSEVFPTKKTNKKYKRLIEVTFIFK